MAAEWAQASGRELLGLTVDHGLRPEAALEAETVGVHCAGLGLPHQTLTWTPPNKTTGQARARQARHALLAGAIRQVGGNLILMGHTVDDQVETIAMRAARSNAQSGLAGIRRFAVSPVWPEGRGVFIGRPLLGLERQMLRSYLQTRGLQWIDDPSNENEKFERVRVRNALREADQTTATSTVGAMPRRKARHLAEENRQAQDRKLAGWLRAEVVAFNDGLIRFDARTPLATGLGVEDLAEGLAWLLMAAAGSDRRANRESRLKLASDILALPTRFQARTLGGAWIAPRQKQVVIARDPGRVGPFPVAPVTGMIWDGRFCYRASKADDVLCQTEAETEAEAVAPMARETCPPQPEFGFKRDCLLQARLSDIIVMLAHEASDPSKFSN